MTKVYFHGDYRSFSGPSNANRYILEESGNRFAFRKSKNKYIKRFEYLLNIILNDVTVFAGGDVYANVGIKLAKKLGRKTVYLMHGLASYESKINNEQMEERFLRSEKYILENVDLILCVSEIYSEWVKKYFPHLAQKIYFVNSGLHPFGNENIKPYSERKNSVAVAGGDLPQKNNIKVCSAVEKINENGKKITLDIYGKKQKDENVFDDFPHADFKGELKQEEFFSALADTKLFVVNSVVESFSLAAADALERGCSILLSKDSGICSVLKLEDTDIIFNTEDENEIAEKIIFLLENPNNERIKSSIDFEKVSWKKTAERLYLICEKLYKGENYRNIK